MTFRTPYNAVDVAIVGAGAAGLTAAIAAAEQGAQVLVFEQLSRPGNKLAAGDTPCSLGVMADPETFASRFGDEAASMLPALRQFGVDELRAFMDDLGVATDVSDGEHVQLTARSTVSVQEALWRRIEELLGTTIKLGARVTGLRMEAGRVAGLTSDAGRHTAGHVILTTGGKSRPQFGPTGSGYALAAQAGHTIIDPVPALVPLAVKPGWTAGAGEIRVPDAEVRIDHPDADDEPVRGEIRIHDGVASGSAILDISGRVACLLGRNGPIHLVLDLVPVSDADALLADLDARAAEEEGVTLQEALLEAVPAPVVAAVAAACGVDAEVPVVDVDAAGRRKVVEMLRAAPLVVTGTKGFMQALITRGGVRLGEVNPETLASRIVEGLYFAGEVLALDGPTGGYNMEWAFSSGHLAGASAGAMLPIADPGRHAQ